VELEKDGNKWGELDNFHKKGGFGPLLEGQMPLFCTKKTVVSRWFLMYNNQ